MPGNGNLEAMRLEYDNAKERLNHQSAQINELGNQGLKMLRVALVTVGLLVTIATGVKTGSVEIGLQPARCVLFEGEICGTVGHVATFTVVMMTGSTLLFASSTGPEIRGIGSVADPEEVGRSIDGYATERQYLAERLNRYQSKIADNEQVIDAIETLAALGGASFALGLIGLVLLGMATVQVTLTGPMILVILLGLVGFYRFIGSRFPDSYLKAEGVGPVFYAILKWKRKTDV